MADAYVQALGLKAPARASSVFSTPAVMAGLAFATGGEPVSMLRVVEVEGEEAAPGSSRNDLAEQLFRKHGAWLRRRLARRFGADLAEDIVQDTWARLVARSDLADIARPRPFLVRIAANLVLDRRRASAVRPSCVPIDRVSIQLADAEGQTQAVLLKQIVLGMPQPLQTVFVLSRFEGLTHQYLESGRGKVDLEKLDLFARVVDADPFALLLAAQFGSSSFAVRAAGNKAAMVLMLALEQFNADAGDRMALLDTASLLSAMSEAFRKLVVELEHRNALPRSLE